jgi:SAM-dependent methyltransferase
MGKINNQGEPATDQVGFSTLNTISSADRFNRWMYETIAPFCKGEIIEIGAGIGNISRCFLDDGKSLTITELHEEYCELLKNNLSGYSSLRKVLEMDIACPEFDKRFGFLSGCYDTVFALNVIEHIGERDQALQNCRKLLKSGGTLVILVPAFTCLYNRFDEKLGHLLRFTRKTVGELMEQNGFTVFSKTYFNTAGIAGWWFTGTILGKEQIPERQMGIYNCFVPLFRLVDKFTARFAGLSVIAAGRKKDY